MLKKSLFSLLFISLLLISVASAVNIKIVKQPLNDIVISELNQPARFIFNITNLDAGDNFQIYTLIGVDMTPRGTFRIEKGQTISIEVDAYIPDNLRKNTGYLTFNYKLIGENIGAIEDTLKVKIVDFKDLFEVKTDDITLDASSAAFYLQNRENTKLEGLKLKLTSAFFDFSKDNITLNPLEKLAFNIEINKDVKTLVAGKYLLTAEINKEDITTSFDSSLKYVEKKDIESSEGLGGLLVTKKVVEAVNKGNVESIETINVRKNIISRLFTSFNIDSDRVKRKGFIVTYTWEENLKPGQTFSIVVKTNWTWPFIIILIIILIAAGLKLFFRKDIEISKKVVYVKTKGGEFALKVILSLRAKKFVENVRIIDQLPNLVKLHEKYGTLSPDRYDEKHRRVEWNLGSLNSGEHRVFSYVIYSNVNVVGRFSLPSVTLIYEREGKILEIESNKVFFLNEIRKSAD